MIKFALVLLAQLGLLAPTLSQGDAPQIFAFGDSLTDEGNSYNAGRTGVSPPRFTVGKATDGPDTIPASKIEGLWVEQMARIWGLPHPTPSSEGGGNYAVFGTDTGDVADSDEAPSGMQVEVSEYLKAYPVAPPGAIYLLWGGTNDLETEHTGSRLLGQEANAIINLKAEIGRLAASGAKYFVWLNLMPIGVTPIAGPSGEGTELQAASLQFQIDEKAAIPELEAAYPGITITGVDVFTLFTQIIASPSAYGLTNVTTDAIGQTTADPDTYLFWDTLHPTTAGHRLIAEQACEDFANRNIAFTAVGPVVCDQSVSLSARAISKLPLTYRVVSGPATITGGKVTFTGVGSVVLGADQAGNGTTVPALEATQTVTVSQATQSLAPFRVIPDQTYSTHPVTIKVPTASSRLPVSVSVLAGPATISGDKLTLTGTGAITLVAKQLGNANFRAAEAVTTSFIVKPAPQTISFPVISNSVFGATVALKAKSSSGLPVYYTHTEGVTLNSAGNAATMLAPRVVEIRAHQDGNADYLAAPAVDNLFTVNPAPQTINFPALRDQTYGAGPITLSATSSSGLPITYTASGPVTLSGSTATITGTGKVSIRARQRGDADYLAAPPVLRVFTVSPAAQTITFAPVPDKTYGNSPFHVKATASSGLAVSYSVVSGPATIENNLVTLTGPGTVVLAANQAGDADYSAAPPVTISFLVNPAP
jgi:phospholipase/lecithinase/hemolysin